MSFARAFWHTLNIFPHLHPQATPLKIEFMFVGKEGLLLRKSLGGEVKAVA
jgi:hypothetical protein